MSIVEKWLEYARVDLEGAEVLVKNPKSSYSYQLSVLHCHQAVEKILKTVIVANNQEVKKIHDLVRLVELAKLKLTEELFDYIKELNAHYQPARYPDIKYKGPILKYNQGIAKYHFKHTKEIFLWIEKKIRSKS